MTEDHLHSLLARAGYSGPQSTLRQVVQDSHPSLGLITEFVAIPDGYEDANFHLHTQTGRYVLKLFAKDRSVENIQSIVRSIEECRKIKVPTLRLISGHEIALQTVDIGQETLRYIITEYVDGTNFVQTPPTIDEMITLAGYLASLHSLRFPVHESYDSWGNKNLVREYSQHHSLLSTQEDRLIAPIVTRLKDTVLQSCSVSVIHGDLQRKHVLKDMRGNLTLIDFGCVAFGPKIIDLSVFLAWFCLGTDTWNQADEIFAEVITRYTATQALSAQEIGLIPTLVAAAYAAYVLATTRLIASGDVGDETRQWHNQAFRLLELCRVAQTASPLI